VPSYAYVALAAGWLIWAAPFLLAQRKSEAPSKVDRRARWGMVLQGIAYALLWQGHFWNAVMPTWRFAFSVLFLGVADVLSWTGTRSLGPQWRFDAGLNTEHQLVTTGAYRFIRHPIYCSMLCLLLGMGLMVTPWTLFLLSTVVFIGGTEIRVRIEDKLLASRFGERFREYQQSVPAYVPFVR
jgi:protein-S-isoprenylcysteine O-methyltransferase Ste14